MRLVVRGIEPGKTCASVTTPAPTSGTINEVVMELLWTMTVIASPATTADHDMMASWRKESGGGHCQSAAITIIQPANIYITSNTLCSSSNDEHDARYSSADCGELPLLRQCY